MVAHRASVVCLEPDLFFATRLDDVIRGQGATPIIVETPDAFVAAVDRAYPVLALLDLNAPGDWMAAITRCKMRPHTRLVPIYAFGSHVETAALQAARKAGADHAWARSRMMEELVDVVARHVQPPVRYPAGWDDDLSPNALRGIQEFNRGEYFEQHEHLEHAWMEEPRAVRAMYQGILQVGVAFFQVQNDNWAGAIKMFRRGLPRLRDLPAVCQGVNVAALRSAAEAIHAEITELGPERLREFDLSRFPQIEYGLEPGDEPQPVPSRL